MHPFDSVLDAMDVESSLYVRIRARAPWGIGFNSGYQARLLVVASGDAWFTRTGQPPFQLHAGDCLIIRKGTECAIADRPGGDLTPCGQVVDRVTGDAVEFGGTGAACAFISARMTFDHTAGEPLLALLPEVVHVPLGAGDSGRLLAIFDLIGQEEAERGLGAGFVIGRLIDTLFIQVIRAWAKAEGNIPSGWLAGLGHHRLAGTLGLIHADLRKPWTIETLARSAAMSRSAFAVLFKSVVGVPPLAYIAGWRIYRAKMLLAGGHSIAKAAELSGYGSDIALSRAFRAATGLSPGQWRARYRADADSAGRSVPLDRPVGAEQPS
ncbi:AraC family transcriptional regulator [Roseixanthobacter pseudopolyaromaticivorans]|uniref:AraC family transcriptional regulator n=1 Tax=Xanthobacteraceae TaxID=335928 RepID=UPI0037294B93